MKKISLIFLLFLGIQWSHAKSNMDDNEYILKDTLYTELKNDVVIISSTKETNSLRRLPAAVSIFSPKNLEAMQVRSLKDLSSFVPNYSVADYGSKMTAPLYIRGIGARSGTQTVSMYVDNIPYFNTTSFDTELMDIQRVEVLRGTQSTLYGRNAMGGILNIYTYSPLDYEGTNIAVGGGTYGQMNAHLSHYRKLSGTVGISAAAYYKHEDGFFKQDEDHPNAGLAGKRIDYLKNGGGRTKFVWKITPQFTANYSVGYDHVEQGAFPYSSKETGKITYSSDGHYYRNLVTNGLSLRYAGNGYEINSTTGYQYLNDEMNMDQDYTVKDVFQINQKQNQNSLSQEISIKSSNLSNYQWSSGVFGFYDYLKTTPPVYMMQDGIDHILQPNVDKGMDVMMDMIKQNIPAQMQGMIMPMIPNKAKFTDTEIELGGVYRSKTYGGAVFHQSTYSNLFADGLSITLGARLDYEKTTLDYNAQALTHYSLLRDAVVARPPYLPMPLPALDRPLETFSSIVGKTSDDYFEFLPKGVLKYEFDKENYMYASVSRGYKTGGHNIQMFADLLQDALQTDMTNTLMSAVMEEVGKIAPPGVLPEMPSGNGNPSTPINVAERVSYKPEYSWSYEVGGQFTIIKDILTTTATAYYMDVKDVQVTQFVSSTSGRPSGRMVANAGKARSQGIELGLKARPCTGVYLYANYGFSDAKFKSYDGGVNPQAEKVDYSGNYIPFAPRSTFSVGGSVSYNMKKCTFLERIILDANFAGRGKIYWDEANTLSQGFHGTVNARLAFEKGIFSFEIWGKNLLNRQYDTFLFTSKDVTRNEPNPQDNYVNYGQTGKPIRLGAAFKVKF